MQPEFGDVRLRQGNGNVQICVYVQYSVESCQRHSGTGLRFVTTSEVYFLYVFQSLSPL